ncbi:MAG: PAS domain-containing protein [Campylobacterales bacterium]|nr:PAS domain-containing protein [Campylobacterales bacterium]
MQKPPTVNAREYQLRDNDFIISKTDPHGVITYCNRIFVEMSGYSIEELIGAPHNIVRHPDMPALAFKMAWELIRSGREFFGFVKNLRKDGAFYWVFAYITPDRNTQGEIIGFTSVRRKPSPRALEQIIPLYERLCALERTSGIEAANAELGRLLEAHHTHYDAFITRLQNA